MYCKLNTQTNNIVAYYHQLLCTVCNFSWNFLFFLYLDREEGTERTISVWLLLMCPLLGIWLATQACTLTGN